MPFTGNLITVPATTTEAAQAIIDDFLRHMLGNILNIQVNGEMGLPNRTRNRIVYNYNPMITDRGIRPEFEYNKEDTRLLEGTDYILSLDDGIITLLGSAGSQFQSTAGALSVGDEIRGFYRFKYFSDVELESYILLGLFELNARKPATAFSLDAAPLEWNAALVMYAYMAAIRRILGDTTLWKSSIVFTDPAVVRDQLTTKLTLALEQWDFLAKVSQRRGWAAPKAVTTRRLATQQRVTAFNWQSFTIGVG